MKRAALFFLLCFGTLISAVHCGSPEMCIAPDGGSFVCDQGVRCEGDSVDFACEDTHCDSGSQYCYAAIGVDGMRFPGVCTYFPTNCKSGCGCDCIKEKDAPTNAMDVCTGTPATGIKLTRNYFAQ